MYKFLIKIFRYYFSSSAKKSFKKRESFVRSRLSRLPPGLSLLDAGAGTQKYRTACSHLAYTSQDLCGYDGQGDGIGPHSGTWDVSKIDIISDICSIPCEDNSFDVILCTDVLEHVVDVPSTIKEFNRLLKVDGELIITVPTNCEAHQTPYYFSGGYSHYFFEEMLSSKFDYDLKIEYESGYFDTLDQKVYLGFVRLTEMAKKGPKWLNFLTIPYFIFSVPLVFFVRLLSHVEGIVGSDEKQVANDGLLIAAKKKSHKLS